MGRKVVQVVCLVLLDQDNFFLATQRPEGKALALHWEFPGGKVELDENPKNALRREIEEELTLCFGELQQLPDSVHEYEFGTICLTPYLHKCSDRPDLILTEHMDSRWVDPAEWEELLWAPADIPIIEHLLNEVILVCAD